MERTQKEILVGELQGIFNSAKVAVLIDYIHDVNKIKIL